MISRIIAERNAALIKVAEYEAIAEDLAEAIEDAAMDFSNPEYWDNEVSEVESFPEQSTWNEAIPF